MRIFLQLAALFFVVSCACAQDNTWLKDVTELARLTGVKSGQISACDINGDDYPDVLLQNLAYDRRMLTRLYLNKQNPDSANPKARIFVDVTDESNIYQNRDGSVKGRVADTWGMADVNNDGYPDIVTGLFYFNVSTFVDVDDRTEVLLNDGTGKFKLVENSGLPDLGMFPATSFCFLDYNLDGNLDIYIGTFSANHQQNVWISGILLKGNGKGQFEDVSEAAGLTSVQEPLYGASVTDWNNDGYPDILTSPYCRTNGTLWKNNGDGTFSDFTVESGYTAKNEEQTPYGNIDVGGSQGNYIWFPREVCQWEALPADFDNDGDMDLAQMLVHGGLDKGEAHSPLTINGGAQEKYKLSWKLNSFQRPLNSSGVIRRDTIKNDTSWSNQYGSFSLPKGHVVVTSAYGHLGDQAGSWMDIDGDMLQDFLLSATGYDATNDRLYIEHQQPDHSFKEVAKELGVRTMLKETHSQRPFDFDLDGDDDFLVEYAPRTANANSGRVWLFKNEIANRNNHISIKLKAPQGCNANCIGSRIKVYSGGVCQTRDIQSGIGRWGMVSPFVLNFGLAKNDKVDSVVVQWAKKGLPTTTVVNPSINTRHTIGENGLVVSVEDEKQPVQEISVYPNPSNGAVSLGLPEQLRTSEIRVCNTKGEIVYQTISNGSTTLSIPANTFPAGMYIVRINSMQGAHASITFVTM